LQPGRLEVQAYIADRLDPETVGEIEVEARGTRAADVGELILDEVDEVGRGIAMNLLAIGRRLRV